MELLRGQGFLPPVENRIPRKWHLPKARHPGDPAVSPGVRNATEHGIQREKRERGAGS